MRKPEQTEREAAALRANLLKRKARTRALEGGETVADQSGPEQARAGEAGEAGKE